MEETRNMEITVFNSLEELERKSNKKAEKYCSEKSEKLLLESYKEKIKKLKDKRDGLLEKLAKKNKLIETLKTNKGNVDMLKESEKEMLLELEQKRINDIINAYRLTGTSVDIIRSDLVRLRLDTSYEGKYYESFYADLKVGSNGYDLHMHSIPSFIPHEVMTEKLNTGLKEMTDFVHIYLQAYIQRRQEAFKIQEKHCSIISGEICSTPSFDYIEIGLKGFDELDVIKLVYGDLSSTKPTEIYIEGNGTPDSVDEEKLATLEKELKSSTLSQVFSKCLAED